jgi:hypothetical protein
MFGNIRQLGDVHRNPTKGHFRDARHSTSGGPVTLCTVRVWGEIAMKTLLVGIAFAIAIVFTSQAFATELPDCPNGKWKHGHYVCGDFQANS